MANLTSVSGFYYQIGSIDYPLNYSPDESFGFDTEGQSQSVFRYSVNDVEKALTKCRTLVKRSYYNPANTNVLLADDVDGALGNQDINSDTQQNELAAWNAAFQIIEYLYNNQSSSNNNPISSGYLSYGDEMLGNNTVDGADNPNYVANYITGSLVMQGSTHNHRLQWVKFTVKGFTSGNVTFYVYFDADAFVERSENVSYAVYRYEDLESPDDQITASEFSSQIVDNRYRKIQILETIHC